MSAIRPLAPELGHPVSLINSSRAAACSGNAMCATCHVYVGNGWLDQLRAMAGDEDALLDGAAAERRAESRLSCQIKMDAGLDSRRDRLIGALECDFIPRDVWANA